MAGGPQPRAPATAAVVGGCVNQAALFGAPPIPAELTGLPLLVATELWEARPHFVKSSDIARKARCNAADVRHAMSELVDTFGLWIVGDRTLGYRLCETRTEFVDGQMQQLRQAITTLQRVRDRIGGREMKDALRRMGILAVIESGAPTETR